MKIEKSDLRTDIEKRERFRGMINRARSGKPVENSAFEELLKKEIQKKESKPNAGNSK